MRSRVREKERESGVWEKPRVCLEVGLASPSGGLESAVGRLLVGLSILLGYVCWGKMSAEAGTCSGGNGPGWVEIGTTFQEGTEVGFLKWGGGPWLVPLLLRGVEG